MEQKNIDSAESYYNHKRKRSFFFSRMFVLVSMVILIAVLGVNVSLMNTNQTTNTKSHASSDEETIRTLPSPPAGCSYHNTNGTVSISCTTPMPKKQTEGDLALNFTLPPLPSGCAYHTNNRGYSFLCSQPQTATVSAAVSLPSTCIMGNSTTAIRCSNPAGQTRNVQLPTLPLGCDYLKGDNTLAITCHQ